MGTDTLVCAAGIFAMCVAVSPILAFIAGLALAAAALAPIARSSPVGNPARDAAAALAAYFVTVIDRSVPRVVPHPAGRAGHELPRWMVARNGPAVRDRSASAMTARETK